MPQFSVRTGQDQALPLRAESQADRAYKILEEMIVTLRLEPGAVLSENQLANELGFGRTPIREALQRLAQENLVVILPRKGIFVAEINPRKQLLALEVRRELERLMSRASALRATADEKALFLKIAENVDQAAQDNDKSGFLRYDNELNTLVAKAARNEYAGRAMGLLHILSRRFWYMHHEEAADFMLCARLHAKLARRIASGSPDEAARASDQLVDYAEAFTRATVSAGSLSLGGRHGAC